MNNPLKGIATKPIQEVSRLEFWGVHLVMFGLTLALFMHLNDRTDALIREGNIRWETSLERSHKIEQEMKDIKLNQAWLEKTKVDKEDR